MKKEDLSIFDYRREKEILFSDLCKAERMQNDYIRSSVYTKSAGWVDFAVYRPENEDAHKDLPAVFVFHGGGFVLGYYEQEGRICRQLADQTKCVLINMDYALAPENKYPIPVISSYEAMKQILKDAEKYHLDSERVMVLGNSSGGCIATDICLLNRDRKEMNIVGQVLNYPPLSQQEDQSTRTSADPSKGVSESRAIQYIHWYFNSSEEMNEPLASPADYADVTGLPEMLMISAELDTLRAEEKRYADRCLASGNKVTYQIVPGVGHGFTHSAFNTFDAEKASETWIEIAHFIRKCTKPSQVKHKS